MQMAQPILTLENIHKSFDGTKVLDGISLSVLPGQFLTLLGPSGCGKTTTLRIIAGLETPDEGRVLLNGAEVTKLPPEKRAVNTVFQNYALFPHMNVQKNIAYPMKLRRVKKEDAARRVEELLSVVQLEGFGKRMPSQLSGGQRQRVAIARALVGGPRFVICDEAVSALDVSVQAQVLNILVELQRDLGLSYLFISHDLAVVRHVCDRIAVMYLGRIVETAATDELFARPRHPYVEALLSAIPVPDPQAARAARRIALEGELPSLADLPEGCVFCTRCPYAQERCRRERPGLVEVAPGHSCACLRADELELAGVGAAAPVGEAAPETPAGGVAQRQSAW